MSTLATKAMLVSLKISQWTARKLDKQETQALMLKHGVSKDIARVHKDLLPMTESLDLIHKKSNAWRWDFYRHSLPWNMDGVQVIKAEAYMDFVRLMRDHKMDWQQLVANFLGEYEHQREQARQVLNGLYRPEDYPTLEELRRKFGADVTFYPLPEESAWQDLAGLSDEEREALIQQSVEDRTRALTQSMQDAWRRMHEIVSHARERLSDPKAIFRDSLVENARQICRTMSVLNIVDDPNLERVRRDIEGALCQHNPDTLRQDPAVRSEAAQKLDAIMSRMGAFYSP